MSNDINQFSPNKIKYFVCHTPGRKSVCPQGSHFIHMMGGSVFSTNDIQDDLIGDNTGDNISKKNKSFCELTIQYWAWKNTDADYYGFFHYRRYLSFYEDKFPTDDWNSVIRPYLNNKTIEELRLNDIEHIQKIISGYDVITPIPIDLKKVGFSSVYDQYKTSPRLNIKDINLLLDIIKDLYPNYSEDAKEYFSGRKLYLCNIFIMKKDIFFEYCEWLFNILFEFEKRSDMSLYSEEMYRTPGHLGERLFGIYFSYLCKHRNIKSLELQLVTIGDSSKVESLSPAFPKESVNIVFSSSEYFAPYCATTIRSLLDQISENKNYDIIILEQEIQSKTKIRLLSMVKGIRNVSIRFFNVKQIFDDYVLSICEHFAVETYFRLILSDFLPEYNKIIYLDSDLIILDDIAKLYDIDISNYCVAGVVDTVLAGHINGFTPEKHRPYYLEKVKIKEKNLLNLINAGVLLINLSKIREQYTSNELLDYAQANNFNLCDQDVINSIFQDKILHLKNEWNAYNDEEGTLRRWCATFAPKEMYFSYKIAIKNPKILHFCGTTKPWNEPNYEYAHLFWDTLKKTPFYELVIHRRIIEISNFLNHNTYKQIVDRRTLKGKIKFTIKKIVRLFFPPKTIRREILKKIYYKFRTHKS